jgi:FixJ family two-component response regulator
MATNATVFVVDDDAAMRDSLRDLIRSVGLRVELFDSAQDFLRSERPDVPGCLVLDVRMPGQSGLDLQRRLNEAGVAIREHRENSPSSGNGKDGSQFSSRVGPDG